MSRREPRSPATDWAFVVRYVRQEIRRHVPACEVEDLTQEVLLTLARKGHTWPSTIARLEPYLRAVARNACRNRLAKRSTGRRERSLELLRELGIMFMATAPESPAAVPDHVPRPLLLALCRRLSPNARRVLVRHFLHGQPIKAVARKLGMSPKGVRYLRDRILGRARTLGSELPPPL